MLMQKILIVCGPTATGKTKLALALAKKFDGELVSADSRQVYKGLDILTGKDFPKDGTPIRLYDVVGQNEPFSVALYEDLARAAIDDIVKRGKLPILVGGTGLYINAVMNPIDTTSVPQNLPLRKTLSTQAVFELQKFLEYIDKDKWGIMNVSDRNNPRRLTRAIEIATWHKNHKEINVRKVPLYDVQMIGLTGSHEWLLENIRKRVRARFRQGVVDEVKQLRKIVNDQSSLAATSLGLTVVRRYIGGEIEKEEAINLWATQEYQYAKRQLTWFKKQTNIHWFVAGETKLLSKVEAIVAPWYTRRV